MKKVSKIRVDLLELLINSICLSFCRNSIIVINSIGIAYIIAEYVGLEYFANKLIRPIIVPEIKKIFTYFFKK